MESFDLNLFAERLKKLRMNRKKNDSRFTQEYVAKKIGVARTTYTAYENGTKEPPLGNVYSLAKLFDVSSDYLIGRSNDPKKSEHDYLVSVIKKDKNLEEINFIKNGKKVSLEELLEMLKDLDITLDGKTLTGEERRRAIEVLKAMFDIKNDN